MKPSIIIANAATELTIPERERNRPRPGGMVVFYGEVPAWHYYTLIESAVRHGADVVAISQQTDAAKVEIDSAILAYGYDVLDTRAVGKTVREYWLPDKFSQENFEAWLEVHKPFEEADWDKYAEGVTTSRLQILQEELSTLLRLSESDEKDLYTLGCAASWLVGTLAKLAVVQPKKSLSHAVLNVLLKTLRDADSKHFNEMRTPEKQALAIRRYRQCLLKRLSETATSLDECVPPAVAVE